MLRLNEPPNSVRSHLALRPLLRHRLVRLSRGQANVLSKESNVKKRGRHRRRKKALIGTIEWCFALGYVLWGVSRVIGAVKGAGPS